MKAFFIANVKVKNPEKFAQYAKAAGESMQPFGGEVLIKGANGQPLAGSLEYPNAALVQFPDQDKLHAWYHSDTYQSLIPLRNEAAEMHISSFSVPE